MEHYLVQPRDLIFVKIYGFLYFAKDMGKNIGKTISKNVRDKYSQKLFDKPKQSATDLLKTFSKKIIKNNLWFNW